MSSHFDHFDTAVIGGGQSGPFLAAKLAERGESVVLIERDKLGGTCVNRGCTPTKTLRKSARVAHVARRARDFGVHTGEVTVDFPAAMARMNERVTASRTGLEGWLSNIDGLTLKYGVGKLAGRADPGAFNIEVSQARGSGETEAFTAGRVILNTGTSPFVPPIPGLATVALTNESLLQLEQLPAHLVVLGGSYIGLEFGQMFRRLGSKVTLIEAGPRLASREDEDISLALAELLRAEGIDVLTGTRVERVTEQDGRPVVHLASGETLACSHVLAATGRTPNTKGLGLESIALDVDERGYIPTNGQLETAVPGVYALGDINHRGAFTHTSYHDHEILADNLRGDGSELRSADDRIPAYAMFTDPPLGHVGIYERDAKVLVQKGARVSQATIEMSAVSRAKEEGELAGKIKLLLDEDSGQFLGATILGIGADEIIQALGLLMACGGTYQQVRNALPVHPTVLEFLPTVLDKRRPLEG